MCFAAASFKNSHLCYFYLHFCSIQRKTTQLQWNQVKVKFNQSLKTSQVKVRVPHPSYGDLTKTSKDCNWSESEQEQNENNLKQEPLFTRFWVGACDRGNWQSFSSQFVQVWGLSALLGPFSFLPWSSKLKQGLNFVLSPITWAGISGNCKGIQWVETTIIRFYWWISVHFVSCYIFPGVRWLPWLWLTAL